MLSGKQIQEIKRLVCNREALASEAECYCYSQDTSNIFPDGSGADIVVFVETIQDVQNIMKYAYEHEIPVISRGAGTNTVGACVCNNGGIILNFSKMNKIIEINKNNMTAIVQPGVVLDNLKKEVEKQNLFYPPDPSNYKVSTVGGSIAQSSGGASSFKYGTTKDYVISLKVVTSSGELMTLGANTVKDSVGYHLNQLIIGSEGTLAVVVEAVLKLIPKPKGKQVISAYFDSTSSLINSVNKIITSNIFPSAIEYMDKNSICTAEDYLHIGLDTNSEGMLLIDVEGDVESIQAQIKCITNILEENSAKKIVCSNSEQEYENIWTARRSSYAAAARLAPDILTDDVIVPREQLLNAISKINEIVNKYNLKMCLIGHVGDANLHPQIILDLNNESELNAYSKARAEIYSEVLKMNGTISAEHGIGCDKKAYFGNFVDKNALEYMKMIKKIFDPKNILNPNKIFDL